MECSEGASERNGLCTQRVRHSMVALRSAEEVENKPSAFGVEGHHLIPLTDVYDTRTSARVI
jgi:hypothetical protein